MKGFLNLQELNNTLVKENETTHKAMENLHKENQLYLKNQKKMEQLIRDNDVLKEENVKLRALITKNDVTKKEKEIKDKENIITDLKDRSDKWISMIKEREVIINELNKKIKELTDTLQQKDEQLKVMVNFSKEINNENKSNVAELTKQAVKTIKLFYNTLNNTNKEQIDNAYRIEFINDNTTFSDFEQRFKNKQTSVILEDALTSLMYIPNDLKSINKEFLMDMNMKTELIKLELFSGLIREGTVISFLDDVFQKLNIKDANSIQTLCSKVIVLKTLYDNVLKENEQLKRRNTLLVENKKEFDLYTKKLKEDMKGMLGVLREKYEQAEKALEAQIEKGKEDNRLMREKCKKDLDKLKTEITLLRQDKAKKEKENEMLKRTIEDHKANATLFKEVEKEATHYIDNSNSKQEWTTQIYPYTVYKFTINATTTTTNSNNMCINSNNDNTINDVNDSFNEKNYHLKKKEISTLKDEISKLKTEMANLMSSSTANMNNLSVSGIAATNDHQHLHQLESQLQNEKHKSSALETNITNLKHYIADLEQQLQSHSHIQVPQKEKAQTIFTPDMFIKMFFNINHKLFSSSELKKFYSIYQSTTIIGVIDIFGKNCKIIKKQIYEMRFDIDTSYTDLDESFINSRSVNMNNSYRLVNDRIVRLKKFEFDFINLSEFLKNYLVAMEIVVKMCFSQGDVIQFEPIEQLYKLFEDCLNYKIDDMNDDIIFTRKVLVRMMRNVKNCLGLSLEYLS
jgi:hypothetical protein